VGMGASVNVWRGANGNKEESDSRRKETAFEPSKTNQNKANYCGPFSLLNYYTYIINDRRIESVYLFFFELFRC
jgi:hypothetical protein